MTKKKYPQQHGVLIVNKPSGPTSAKCLNDIKYQLDQKKIGHAGTLDPLAEGVLVVLLGKATKIAPYITSGEKTYRGRLRLGLTTDTYDIQGTVTGECDPSGIDSETAEQAVLDWKDVTVQEVPAYSAAKHKGKPLYALARAGEEVPVKKKPITVTSSEVVSMELPEVEFRVSCSAGTYIRSLVHSLGIRIGCGATMTALLREASHPFTLEQSYSLEDILAAPESLAERVLPITEALPDWPKAVLPPEEAAKVKNGIRLPTLGQAGPGARAFFLDSEENPLALAEAQKVDGEVLWTILRGLW